VSAGYSLRFNTESSKAAYPLVIIGRRHTRSHYVANYAIYNNWRCSRLAETVCDISTFLFVDSLEPPLSSSSLLLPFRETIFLYFVILRKSIEQSGKTEKERERERERERDENLRSRVPYSREISGNSRLLTALSKNISDRKRRVCRALYFPREGIISPSICRATGSCQLRSVRNSGSPEVGVNFTDVDNML